MITSCEFFWQKSGPSLEFPVTASRLQSIFRQTFFQMEVFQVTQSNVNINRVFSGPTFVVFRFRCVPPSLGLFSVFLMKMVTKPMCFSKQNREKIFISFMEIPHTHPKKNVYHLESRWRNSHVVPYTSPPFGRG